MRADLISDNYGRLLLAKQADLNNWQNHSIMLGGNYQIMGVEKCGYIQILIMVMFR